MRSHSQIVRDFGGAALVRALAGLGAQVSATTPQRWSDRDSIPAEYWLKLVQLGAASLDELARGADPNASGIGGLAEEGAAFERAGKPTPSKFIYPPLARTIEGRQAALHALLAMAGQGYRSEAAPFDRDALYDRGDA